MAVFRIFNVGAGFKPTLCGQAGNLPLRFIRKNEKGLTLVEMIISLAILSAIIVPISFAIRAFLFLPSQGVDEYDVMNQLRNAAQLIAIDARQADTFIQGSNPNYATLSWTDYIDPAGPNYVVLYYFSPSDNRLVRQLTVTGVPPVLVVLENVASYEDVSISLSGGLLTVSLTATVAGVRKTFSTSENLKAKPRPTLPSTQTTPSPLTLAWDDFESGAFSGGGGWLAPWSTSGLASIVATGFPEQGNYHMLLQSNTGLASRSVNLAGQANVHVQFWAKAASFNSGNTATFQVSSNGTTWTVVKTWTLADADNVYRYWDLDISSFSMTSAFWIRYQANMTNASNLFYVDSVYVVRAY